MSILSCTTLLGVPCKFPFSYQGVSHTSCTKAGRFASWCATGDNMLLDWGLCSESCPQEEECSTVRSGG